MPAATALPAATLLLLRDGEDGLEVLMMRRSNDGAFGGALVFPGGCLDPADGAGEEGYRVAAIRECYEETRILLARRRGEGALLGAAELAALEGGRRRHFAELLAASPVELATDCLTPFGHWVTPARSPQRFDAHFFLAPAPEGQAAEPDGREAVATLWLRPAQAIAEADAGRHRLIFATRMNLGRLGQSRDVASAIAAAAASAARIVPITPEIYDAPDGERIRIPSDLGYPDCDMKLRR